jgi:hypothetical protein
MEPKCLLACSQQPDTGPYSEPTESNPQSTAYFCALLKRITSKTIYVFKHAH